MREDTLVFLLNDNHEILLAMKKRGFGVGKYNGVGGKVIEGETVEQAAVREAHEEIGVVIDPTDLEKVAELTFTFDQKNDFGIHCHAFLTKRWKWTPTESEEMAPQWFPVNEIPFDSMWVDDPFWLPHVLRSEKLKAEFHFSNDGSELLSQHIKIL